jgi:hypothetical protein
MAKICTSGGKLWFFIHFEQLLLVKDQDGCRGLLPQYIDTDLNNAIRAYLLVYLYGRFVCRETGMESYGKEVAHHSGLELCAVGRKVTGDALTEQ